MHKCCEHTSHPLSVNVSTHTEKMRIGVKSEQIEAEMRNISSATREILKDVETIETPVELREREERWLINWRDVPSIEYKKLSSLVGFYSFVFFLIAPILIENRLADDANFSS